MADYNNNENMNNEEENTNSENLENSEDLNSSSENQEAAEKNDASAVNAEGNAAPENAPEKTEEPEQNASAETSAPEESSYTYSAGSGSRNGTAPDGRPYASGYRTYDEPGTYSHEFTKKKEKKSNPGVKRNVFTVILCCVLSLACGFGGAFAYSKFFGTTKSSVIYESSGHAGTVTDTSSETVSLADVIDSARSSVVEITTEYVSTGTFFSQYISQGAGSGVILTSDGYIVTNYHVIESARSVTVTTLDGTEYSATVVGYDSENDIAVVKIDATGLTPATFGNYDEVRVGDSVFAIGNPLGSLGGTVTEGIVSALDRTITIDGTEMTLLQTSAAVNPGNSGGGLFNEYGELIGIVNAKSTSTSSGDSVEGIGFAIPCSLVKEIATDIMENGSSSESTTTYANKAVLGITVIEISTEQQAYQYGVTRYGVYIASVEDGYGAANAGLQSGDYIVSCDSTAISATDDLTSLLAEKEPGDHVQLQVIRNNMIFTVDVELMDSGK